MDNDPIIKRAMAAADQLNEIEGGKRLQEAVCELIRIHYSLVCENKRLILQNTLLRNCNLECNLTDG